MTDNENQIVRQVETKIKDYNRNRVGSAISITVFIGILVFVPTPGLESLPVQLSVFSSAVFLLCSAVFLLPFQKLLVVFFITTSVTALLFFLTQIRIDLFSILFFINIGILFRANANTKIIVHSFMTEMEEINHLKIQATVDSLTQLLNRNGLEQSIKLVWNGCKRDKKHVGIILVDIDYFKNYNDTLGHPEGDNILRQVADSIRNCFKRKTDIVSRIGGDEFLIFLPDIKDDYVLKMSQKLSADIIRLNTKINLENIPCNFLSVSIGIVTRIPQVDDTLTAFYKKVDEALYDAKKLGRNCISFNGHIIQSKSSVYEIASVNPLSAKIVYQNEEN
ncbi:GGDEF domain-containing protein [Pectinatus frisingensis]|uniref:GGDEF domain-containing protein n=1 Tax=Pectinatus frisingensis TaxID=865 RepID=UPI0018C5A2EF|nr:GGDEF domain-containing protein [Pectinatus frisingensis]